MIAVYHCVMFNVLLMIIKSLFYWVKHVSNKI